MELIFINVLCIVISFIVGVTFISYWMKHLFKQRVGHFEYYLAPQELKKSHWYVGSGRNGKLAKWDGEHFLIPIFTRSGVFHYTEREYHYDSDPRFGTFKPKFDITHDLKCYDKLELGDLE